MRRIARRFRFALLALLAVAVWSCEDHTGPSGITARFALAPTFASSSAGIVDIDSVRVRLFRADEALALDTVVAVEADAESVALDLRVVISSTDEVFQMYLEFITPTGETAFTGGPVEVSPSSDDAEPVVIDVEVVYVGVGADAASVEITTTGASVLFGDTVQLTAVARNSAGDAIPGTPVAWSSQDPARATVPDEAVGDVVGGSTRGTAVIQATLLTGPIDTASVLVQPVPSLIVVTGGNDQRGPINTELPVPVTVVVSAADELPVQGVPVLFQTADGGSFSVDSADTDASGQAQTLWTLGAGVGPQSATATVAGFPTVQAAVGATAVSANVLSWTNALGGNWSDPANWDLARAPVASDTVNIDLAGDYTVTLDVNATVGALNLGGSSGVQILSIASNTLTLGGDATVGLTGRITLSGGTLDGTGNLDVFGSFALSGGTLDGSGIVTLVGGFDWTGGTMTGTGRTVLATSSVKMLSGGLKTLDGRLLVNQGTLTWTTGAINALNGAEIQNVAAATFDIQGDEFLSWVTGAQPTFANAGSLTRTVGTGVTSLGMLLSGAGPVDVQSGTLALAGGGTLSGAVTVGTAATLQFSGGTMTLGAGSSVSGDGTIDFSGGAVMVLGTFDNTSIATTRITGGTVNFENTTNPATVTSLTLSAGTLGGAGDVQVSTSFDWSGGTMSGTGQTVLEATAAATMGGALKTLDARGLVNQGSLVWTAGAINALNGAAIQNASGATFDIQGDESLSWTGAQPTFANAGGLTRTVGTGVASLDVLLSGAGSVDVQSGTLALAGGGTVSGAVTVGTAATLQFSGGTMTLDASSSVTGAGRLEFSGGAVTVLGTYAVTGTSTHVTGGTVNFENTTTPATTASLVMSGGAIGGAGDLQVSTSMSWDGGTIGGGGQLLIQSTAAATFAGGIKVLDSKELVNQGSVTWTAGDIDVQNGAPISNSSGASLDIQGNVVLDWTTGGEPSLVNAGTVTRSVGTGSAAVNFMFINGGTLDVQSGTLGMNASFSHQSTATIQGAGTLNLSGGLVTAGTINMTGRLSLPGILSPTGTYSVGTTVFTGASQTIPSTLTYQDVEVTGANVNFAAGATSILGSLVINGGMLNVDALDLVDVGVDVQISNNGELYIGSGGAFTVTGDFQTMTGGHFSMTTGTDVLTVKGNVDIQGGSTNTLLTDGTMYIGGSFSQGPAGDPAGYAPSNLFLTVFNGTGINTVSFANPGPAASRFQDLELAHFNSTDVLNFTTDVYVAGNVDVFSFPPAGATSDAGVTVTVADTGVDNGGGEGGVWDVEHTLFSGTTTTWPNPMKDVTVTGSATATFMTITGDLVVAGSGSLDLNSSWVFVNGDFQTQDNGTLAMSGTSDQLTVDGTITFGGGSTDGLLVDGIIIARGDFTQLATTSPESFHAGGVHKVDFVGTAAQTLSVATPGIGVGQPFSHFANVAFNNTVGVTLLSDAFAHSDLSSNSGTTAIIIGNGNTLAVGGLDVNDLELRRVLLEWNGTATFPSFGSFVQFTNVLFTSYNGVDTQLSIIHPGTAAATDFFFGSMDFDTQPGVGYYVKAEDSDAVAPVLEIDIGFFFIGTTVPPDDIKSCNATDFNEINGAQIFYSCS